jgi:glycoside/pentoside/hexuronide:cation symporter, GPH family
MAYENSNGGISLDERVTLGQKLSFGFAGAGVSLLSNIINGPISVFYSFKLGLTTDKVALAMLIFAVWNALNDPLFGIIEDRTKSRLGRRIPYLRYGAPVFGFLFVFCWYPFIDLIFADRQWALFANLLLALFLFDTIFTIIGLITYSLPAEICITEKGRNNLQIYSIYLGAIGMIGSMILTTIFLSSDTPDLSPWFKPVMIITAFVGSLMVFIPSFFLVENEYAIREESLGFFKAIAETFKNGQFLWYEFSNFFYQIGWVVLTGLIAPFVGYVLKFTGLMSSIPLLLIFAMVFVFIIPSSIISKKWGNKKMYMISLVASAVIFVAMFFASENPIWGLIVMVVVGIAMSPVVFLNPLLMFEIIDQDELLTGKRRETTYAGMNAVFTKPAISVANALFFWIIGEFGFVEGQSSQLPSAIYGIRFAYCLIPAVSFVLATLFMFFYKLEGPDWNKKKKMLEEIHKKKEQEYIEKLAKEGKISVTYKKFKN